jgi:Dynamin family
MTTAQRLTVSSLEETVDITGHLDFLEEVLSRYQLAGEHRAQWAQLLKRIKKRQEDRNLYLAVVGEFSSGKSTLVNALIRQNLLPTDVLPATTSAAILVRYGPKPLLRVEYHHGRVEQYAESERFDGLVKRFTSEEEVARTVARVTVECPAPMLKQGLVAVDMPGTNVENRRHVELAGWAIHELCDAAIVAIPANIPAAATLIEFLRVHLPGALHRCVFVVTKIDLVRPRERQRLLDNVAARLSKELEVTSPLVLPMSAAAALGEPLPDGTYAGSPTDAGADYRSLQVQFLETEERIVQDLHRHRNVILLERSSALLSEVFEGLQADLRTLEARHQAEHEALEANRVHDLKPYIRDRKARHASALTARSAELAVKGSDIVSEKRTKTLAEIDQALNGAASDAALRKVLREDVQTLLSNAQWAVGNELGGLFEKIAKAGQKEMKAFEKDFGALYTSLRTLGGKIDLDGKEAAQELGRLAIGMPSASTKGLLERVEQDEKSENQIIGAGAFSGAILGQILIPIPVLGAALGSLIGAALGAMFGPDLATLRQRYREQLRPAVDGYFSNLESAAHRSLVEAGDEVHRQLHQAIDQYSQQYDALVQRMIARDRSRAEEVARTRRRVQADLESLEQRRQDLQRVRAGLQKIR